MSPLKWSYFWLLCSEQDTQNLCVHAGAKGKATTCRPRRLIMFKHDHAQAGLQVRDPAVFKEHAAGKDKSVKVKWGGPIGPILLKLSISIKSWTLIGQGSHLWTAIICSMSSWLPRLVTGVFSFFLNILKFCRHKIPVLQIPEWLIWLFKVDCKSLVCSCIAPFLLPQHARRFMCRGLYRCGHGSAQDGGHGQTKHHYLHRRRQGGTEDLKHLQDHRNLLQAGRGVWRVHRRWQEC